LYLLGYLAEHQRVGMTGMVRDYQNAAVLFERSFEMFDTAYLYVD
jgi:hypothetical protein